MRKQRARGEEKEEEKGGGVEKRGNLPSVPEKKSQQGVFLP